MARGYFRPNVDEMSGYTPGEQPAADADVIKLNTNENPYPPSPKVLQAISGSADEAIRLYPDPTACGLREAAARAYGFEPECIIAGNGSDELLAMLVRALVSEGERVAYPVPTYSLYATLVRAHGAEACEVPWADGYAIPRGLADADARLVILCRPNAPTGTMVPVDSVRELARSLECVLCVDEAYVDFADSEDDNCLPLARDSENVVVLRTLSKSFSLAGARVGLAFAHGTLIEGLNKVRDSYNLSRMALSAGEAALGDMDWMRTNVSRIRVTRSRLVERLAKLGIECLPSQANFLLARVGYPRAKELHEKLKARGILVRYFEQEAVRDCLRITIGTDSEIDALLGALEEFTKQA